MSYGHTAYPKLDEHYQVTGYPNSSVATNGAQWNPEPGTDPNIGKDPESVDDDEGWEFDGAIDGSPHNLVL